MSIPDRKLVEAAVREAVMAQLRASSPGSAACGTAGAPKLVVNASARHMHVTQEDLETLFGPGATLNVVRPLYQDGHFASDKTVTLLGPKQRMISSLRILGPTRKYTQIELARTDVISLGIPNVPVRNSGDIEGTPGAFVMGKAGMLEMKKGVIRANLHVHMGPDDAAYYGVKDKEYMKLHVKGPVSVIFDRLYARVEKGIKLEVHLDTDEANACDLANAEEIRLYK